MKKPLDTALLFAEIDKSVRTEVDAAVAAVMQEQAEVGALAEKRSSLEMRNVELRLDNHEARIERSEHVVNAAAAQVKACEVMCAESTPVKTYEAMQDVAAQMKACEVMCDERCAQAETKVAELTGLEGKLATLIEAQLDAKIATLPTPVADAAPSVVMMPPTMPSEYVIDVTRGVDNRVRSLKISADETQLDIDVVRGGDDRIHSLRVRTQPVTLN